MLTYNWEKSWKGVQEPSSLYGLSELGPGVVYALAAFVWEARPFSGASFVGMA